MSEFYDIPFVPSSDERLQTMVELADITPRCMTIDLGCGDCKVVHAMAQAGALAHGVEIDPNRFQLSCENLSRAGLFGKAFVCHGSMWEMNLKPFDVITIYGITGMMGKLEKKIRSEAKPGSKFISNGFLLPNWSPTFTLNSVHLYIR